MGLFYLLSSFYHFDSIFFFILRGAWLRGKLSPENPTTIKTRETPKMYLMETTNKEVKNKGEGEGKGRKKRKSLNLVSTKNEDLRDRR